MLEDIFVDMSVLPLNGFPMLQVNFPGNGSGGVSIVKQYFTQPGPNHVRVEDGDIVRWLMENLSHKPLAKLWGEFNQIALQCRRARANRLVCSSSGAALIKLSVPFSNFKDQGVLLIIDERMPPNRAIVCYAGQYEYDRFAAYIDQTLILNDNYQSYATVIDLDE